MNKQFDFGAMAFDKKAAKSNTGSMKSGVYEFVETGLFPVENTNKAGVSSLTFTFVGKTLDNKGVVCFGLVFTETFPASGKANPHYSRNQELLETLDCLTFETATAERKIKGKMQEETVLANSVNKTCTIAIQKVISEWNGVVKEQFQIDKSWKDRKDAEGYSIKDYDQRSTSVKTEAKKDKEVPAWKKS